MYFPTELGIRLSFVKTSEFRVGGGVSTPLPPNNPLGTPLSSANRQLILAVVFIPGVPLATEPGICVIILTPMKILQRNFEQGYVRCVRNEEGYVCSVCLQHKL
jgi:hypothetical protein